MDLKIKYIGNDLKYWSKLKHEFARHYQRFTLHFYQQSVDENTNARQLFVKTYQENISIIYVDFSINPKTLLYFCKLINRNNITRLSSLVALHNLNQGDLYIKNDILAGVRLSYFKHDEVDDTVFGPVSLLNVELANDPPYVLGKEIGKSYLQYILRVAYIEDDRCHIETNAPLPLDKIIELENAPLPQFSLSKRVYVKNFSDQDLYYNSRFAYDLEFTYIDDQFFRTTEESWLTYKIYRDNPLGLEQDTQKRYQDIYDDVVKRKEKIRPVREKVRQWIAIKADEVTPKQLKILVIDNTFSIFQELDTKGGDFPYSINIQNELVSDFYQIKRTRPHLIVLHFDDVNNQIVLEKLIKSIQNIDTDNYRPYILVFNFLSNENLNKKLNYPHILSYAGKLDLDYIAKLAKTLDGKMKISHNNRRVFFTMQSLDSTLHYKREINIMAINEQVIYFQCDSIVPNWTTFVMQNPAKMLVTTIPHRQGSVYSGIKNCYRGILHGLDEHEKMKLRRAVNKSLAPDD
jgi:hypothetical protein